VLRQADGAALGELPVSGALTGAPMVSGDLALVATPAGVTAVDLLGGQQRWFTPHPLVRHGSVAVGGRLVCLVGDGLLAFNLADGTLRWQAAVSARGLDPGAPAMVGATVYLPGQRPSAFRALDGEPVGTAPPSGPVAGAVTAAGELLWHGSADGALSAWRASDGVELWRTDVGLPLKAGPLVLGNAVLVADFDGNVHAYASPAR